MRTAYVVAAGLLLLNIVFQFLTAGGFIVGLGQNGDWLDPHGGGSVGVHLFPLLMIIFAAVGKLGKTPIILAVVLLVLGFFQVAITESGIAFLHPLNALVLFFLGHHALQLVRREDAGPRGDDTVVAPAS